MAEVTVRVVDSKTGMPILNARFAENYSNDGAGLYTVTVGEDKVYHVSADGYIGQSGTGGLIRLVPDDSD